MLIPRKLDDQTYQNIVREAVSRLPWLCSQWTDHNAHDPGITLLELFAWYKEMLQFQMEQTTPSIQRALLALSGVTPKPPEPAVCSIEIPENISARLALSRLNNSQDIPFELMESIPAKRAVLREVWMQQEEQLIPVDGLLDNTLELQPFAFGGKKNSVLQLGFERSASTICLWFSVTPPHGAVRNPFVSGQQPLRQLAWTFLSGEKKIVVQPLSDDTHQFSQSGYVRLPVPDDWEIGRNSLRWLEISQEIEGCEEQPRLHYISDRRYQAIQRQTRARSYFFTVSAQSEFNSEFQYKPESQSEQTISLTDAFATTAELAVFFRDAQGWEQLEPHEYSSEITSEHRLLRCHINTMRVASDGLPNLLIVGLDPLHIPDLLFDTKGRPGETLYLHVDKQTVLPQNFQLLCQTLEPDGCVRPDVWRYTEDLYACNPRDRVFTYDTARETICFGNGQYGAIPVAGKGSVMVMNLTVSQCGGGNIPANAGLFFTDDHVFIDNAAAVGGTDRETIEQAARRQLRLQRTTGKCLSASDYETQARRTPGLRVAAAKALPDYDPRSPLGTQVRALVTIVVLPASDDPRPQPSPAFLDAVTRQLESCRMVGIQIQVIPPRYVETDVTLQLRIETRLSFEIIQKTLTDYFSIDKANFGAVVRRSDVAALLQQLPGVLEVRRLELSGAGQNVYRSASGDIHIPPEALAVLRNVSIDLARV